MLVAQFTFIGVWKATLGHLPSAHPPGWVPMPRLGRGAGATTEACRGGGQRSQGAADWLEMEVKLEQ